MTEQISSAQPHHGVRQDASERIRRLFRLLTLVRSRTAGRPLGRDELADACRCSVRTVQRDLDLLRDAGAPLEYDPITQAYSLADKGWAYPLVSFTGEDALALALALGMLVRPGMPDQQAVSAVLDKATAGLPADLKALLADAAGTVHGGTLARDYSAAPIMPLMSSAREHQTVEIDYRSLSSGEQAWRRVDPYAVEARDGQYWELHGWCHRNTRVRTFALDRVHGMRPTSEGFTVRQDDWAAFVSAVGVVGGLRGGTPVAVDVWLAPDVAPYALDRYWPDGLTVAPQPDGSARLTGTAQGLAGMVPEILRWRRHARVLGGPELRAALVEEAQAIAALYAEDAPPPDEKHEK